MADTEREAFEKAMGDSRFFPAELDFSRTKSPSGRDEYANSHLQSNWEGWQARSALASRPAEVDEEGAVCKECNGTGEADSGGTHPWGDPAMITCGCRGTKR